MGFDTSVFTDFWPMLLSGIRLSLTASGLSIVFAMAIGALLAMARLSHRRALAWPALAYIEFGRNLPFIIVLFLLFYVLPAYGIRLPALLVGVGALSLYSSTYFAEIIRGAILSVPKGQMESARATGMSRVQALRYVIVPQMLGYLIPPSANQAIMVVKESSILSTITIAELTMTGTIVQSYTYSPVEVFLLISVLYWLACSALSWVGQYLEVALQPYRHKATVTVGRTHV